MKSVKRRIIQRGLLFAALCVQTGLSVLAASPATSSLKTAEMPYESYTYWEDYGAAGKTPVYCKPMYKVAAVIGPGLLGFDNTRSVADVCTDENGFVYILDSGASKIYVTDSNYSLYSVIDTITLEGAQIFFEGASGIFSKAGQIYVADTKNARVLVFGLDGRVSRVLEIPDSPLIPEGFQYRPIKVAVDSKDYIYIASDGSYYGALVYSPQNEFLGFYGANTVKSGVLDAIGTLFDRLFSNDVKKGASTLALPYQFNDLVCGSDDFIYTATGKSSDWRIQTGQIHSMNPGGKDVLNKDDFNFADTSVGTYKRVRQVQSMVGMDVDKDGFFYVVDAAYGRVFWYDKECALLSVFGGSMGYGQQIGAAQLANAVAVNGTDVLVGDSMKNTVTVFRITEYGRLVRNAQLKTLEDDFQGTAEMWKEVEAQDKNSQLAYRGLARACYAAGDYRGAAVYARLGADRDTYAAAFSKSRQAYLERWFPALFGGVLLAFAVLTALFVVKKRKSWRWVTNEKALAALSSVFHPFESFRAVKEKQLGSLLIGGSLLAAYYAISALYDSAVGFSFNYFDASTYNSFYVLLSTVGLVLLWTGANWLVCVLMGGIGKLDEIFIVTCYSLIPTLFADVVSLLCTHVLVPDEFVFVGILQTICTVYTFFMLAVGTMKIHDFDFGKFVGTSLLTIVSMVVILFLIFLVFLLSQQVYGWFYTLFLEAKYR